MEFENDNLQSENPFVDKLFKTLKVLVYNSIIKDEYTANRLETEESLKNAEIYMACIENRVSLAMFENIPEQFLRSVGLSDYYIRSYYNLNCDVDAIPKDNPSAGITYRSQLLNILKPWFLLNYKELNEYYRKITGQPPLDDWGIPVRDYEFYMPDGFTYQGEFFHEIGVDACRDLEAHGVLDIVRQDYPHAEYLNYLTSGLSVYEVRNSVDFMILWMPDSCDQYITEEFKQRYQERRDFLLRCVYNSAMEIESEHYHAVMQIYLLIMTMVDMLADIQSHMAKKDILDRRCIQYIFDMYGVPYFKSIPYKYQERICHNLHNLIKYKACSHNFDIIREVFNMPDLEFFRYYLVKVMKRDTDGEIIWEGNKVTKSNYNDEHIKTTVNTIPIVSDDIKIPYPIEDYLQKNYKIIVIADGNVFLDYTITDTHLLFLYENVKGFSNITVYFLYTEDSIDIIESLQSVNVQEHYQDIPRDINLRVDFPIENFNTNGNQIIILVDNTIFTNYTVNDDHIYILYDDIKDYSSIEIRFIYYLDNNIQTTIQNINIKEHYKDIIDKLDDIKINFPIENFIQNGNKVIVIADGNIIDTYYTTDSYLYFLYEEIQEYNTLNIFFIYTSSSLSGSDISIYPQDYYVELPQYYEIDFPIENYIENGNYFYIFVDNALYTNYIITDTNIKIAYRDIKDHASIDAYFYYSSTEEKLIKTETTVYVGTDLFIQIPEPVDNYLSNHWPLLALVASTNDLIPESNYDIIESTFSTIPTSKLIEYQAVKFIFFYLESSTYQVYEEDYDKTTELIFSKVPDSYLYSIKHILDESNWKYYDIMISKDPWWIGQNYKDNYYDLIKNNIFNSNNNYIRSKYYGISRMVELSTNTTKVSFFYSALFDDILLENNLLVKINSLSNVHLFNMAHIFIYLSVLTSIYYRQEDIDLLSFPNNIYAAGFNYRANLNTLRKYIISQHFDPNNFKVWDMIIPTEEISDIKEFMSIQEHNEEIYYYVRYNMVDAHDYKEYLIWKYIEEYLMTWHYNQEFFKLSSGNIASSYTDYLREKDIILYDSIQRLKSIEDEELKIDTIAGIIDDACYILEEYIDNELSRYIFSEFVGHSIADVLTYVIKLIEFFKSIKIIFRDKGEQASLGTGGIRTINEDTVFNYYDYFDSKCISRQYEYYPIDEDLYTRNISKHTDNFTDNILEDCVIIHKIHGIEEDVYNAN